MKKEDIPEPILARVENELLAGERLLWVGMPGRKHLPSSPQIASKLIAVGLLALVAFGMAAFMMASEAAEGTLFLPLMGIFAIGIVVAALAQVRSMQTASHQLYAVTNRRAIILSKNNIQSYSSDDLQFIERTMHRDGTGNVIFREEHYKQVVPAGAVMTEKRERVTTGFYGVENPAEVEALMLETFRGGEAPGMRLRDEAASDDELYYEEDDSELQALR